MEIIAAPARAFKTYSMLMLIATGIFDLAVLLLKTLGDLHVMSAESVLAVNAILAFLTGCARLIQQQIAMTTDQKSDAIAAVAAQPMKAGNSDLQVTTTLKEPAP